MINEHNQIPLEKMKITQAILPVLEAGEYHLHAKGTIVTDETKNQKQTFETDTFFQVSAPRFALGERAVYSFYPARSGDYSRTLPNIVFYGRTLPWDRIFGVRRQDVPPAPWLALLLLDEDEIKQHQLTAATVTLGEFYSQTVDVIKPNLAKESIEIAELDGPVTQDTPRYTIIDLPCPLLCDIVPYANELPLLAHAKQVDTADKETPQVENNGWYSSVVCNRLPTPGKKNTVLLVSMEGHEENIKPENLKKTTNSTKKVRFAVLEKWEFTCEGEDFETLVNNIEKNTGLLNIAHNTTAVSNPDIKKAFAYGYTALNHELRTGDKSISWFRGPLAPVSVTKPTFRNLRDADAALRFDESTAMFDVSYASAWQLGRLLALQEPGFMSALQNWKKSFENDFRLSIARRLLHDKFKDEFSFPEDEGMKNSNDGKAKIELNDAVNTAERDEFVNSLMAELWNEYLNPHS